MSILDEIAERVAEGRLVLLEPMIPGSPHPRLIYAGPILQGDLAEPWDHGDGADRVGRLMADFDLFSTGGLVVASTGGEASGYMKHLEPLAEEVWVIRSRDPKPSLRVFGRFAATDIFIATHMCARKYLGKSKSKESRDEYERTKTEWRKLFAEYQPVSGASINDYISKDVVAAGSIK